MRNPNAGRLTRRRFMIGAAVLGVAGSGPAVSAQEQPPVIEPIEPEDTQAPVETAPDQPIGPEGQPAGQIEQIAERSAGEYYAETGHNIDEPFLEVWRQAGGIEVVGYPLSEERFNPDSGAVEQYFDGIVLVNAANENGQWVTEGRPLGDAMIGEWAPASARQAVSGCTSGDASCQFFPETGHTVSGAVAARWTQGGGAAIFGLPRSEPFRADNVVRQVFERAVLDIDTSGRVSAAPAGRRIVEAEGLDGDAAFLPAPPTLGTSTLVSASDGLRLRAAPSMDAEIVAVLDDNAEFIAVTGAAGEWIPGYADGYSGYVSADYLTARDQLPTVAVGGEWDTSIWQGAALAETNIRNEPSTDGRILRTIQYGDAVTVVGWVKGEQIDGGSDTWAKLQDGSFMFERNVGRAGPVEPTPVPADAPTQGRWVDCNLTQQLIVAYEGRTPVRVAVTTTGKPGWETPAGYFAVNNRVANETMESGSIGAAEFYKLENVLYTQYFTDVGHALHFAWWKTPETIGRPGSHGCLNLLLEDAEFFWNFCELGTPVYSHY